MYRQEPWLTRVIGTHRVEKLVDLGTPSGKYEDDGVIGFFRRPVPVSVPDAVMAKLPYKTVCVCVCLSIILRSARRPEESAIYYSAYGMSSTQLIVIHEFQVWCSP